MKNIVVLGSGNVAQHLIQAIVTNSNLNLVQAFARNSENLISVLPKEKICCDLQNLAEADVYILAVTDKAIEEITKNLPFKNRLVAHTSGSSSLDIISDKNRKAVFYPLQTFSKNKAINFKEVPICLEAETTDDLLLLKEIASILSNSVYEIDSNQRKSLHVAAVFASNFTNHMYALAEKICVDNAVDFEILKPLILETSDKIKYLSPTEAQTGPAVRKDTQIIATHLNFIPNNDTKEIYKLLTKSIIDHVQKL
jgi:predicted short-subunit dehydrogenase-like oxidoreductase (DUF2520 family)